MSGVRALATRDAARWRAATSHPFLDGARTGDLPVASFDRWLEQDRLFVATLARAWARMLAVAPDEHLGLLSDGIAAFVAEVAWFDDLARTRGLASGAAPLDATAAYQEHLLAAAGRPFPVALAAMWAVEAAYLEAWRSARPGAPAYRAFVEHWTDPDFADFVERLEAAVDAALVTEPTRVDAAAAAVAEIADHEAAFWAMTWSG